MGEPTTTTLSIPHTASASSNAAIQLLVQVYVQPYLSSSSDLKIVNDCDEASNSELSLTLPSSSPKTDSKDFLSIFKALLECAGQTSSAFPAAAAASTADAEKWISAATSLTSGGEGAVAQEGDAPLDVKALDEHLKTRTYVAGGSTLSAGDVAVYGALAGYLSQASHDKRLEIPSVTRHFDLLQHTPKIATAIQKLSPNVLPHEVSKVDVDAVPLIERKYESSKKDKKEKAAAAAGAGGDGAAPAPAAEGGKKSKKDKNAATAAAAAVAMEADSGIAAGTIVEQKKSSAADGAAEAPVGQQGKKEKKAKKEGGAAAGEGGKPKKEKGSGGGGNAPAEPEVITPGLVDMRVGHIIDVKKHPDADSLYIEQIDVGEAESRTVVSGLVNYIPIEQMQGKYLIAVCNLKPASMRGVKSFAMVLAATSADGKEGMGSVELVAPPEGSKPGDRVYFEGFEDVKALEQLPPKKKIFETVQPGFTTLESREAAWIDPSDKSKVHRIRTERGVCKAPTFVGASLS